LTNGLPTRGMLIFVALAVLVGGCAEIGRPPGGEPDRKGPYLVESNPENGALNVPIGYEVNLILSERIVKPTKGRPVFVSPRPETDPKIKWKRDRIEIIFNQFFKSDQTYIITVSNDVTDLRRNALDSNISIAFSTGDAIDSGRVAGRIIEDNLAATGYVASLYRMDDLGDSVMFDSIYPYYATSTDKEGRFEFRYLPDGEYRLIGFRDKNHNERFNPLREPFALPDRAVTVGGDLSLDDLVMSVTTYDTLTPEIISAVITNDDLLRLRLNQSISLDLLNPHPANLQLLSIEDSQLPGTYSALGFLEYGETESISITASFDSLPVGSFRIELFYDAAQDPLIFESVEVRESEDKAIPTIISFRPENRPMFVSEVEVDVTFSEPIDTSRLTDESFLLLEDDEAAIPIQHNQPSPFTLAFEVKDLKPGRKYRMDIAEFDIYDAAGNQLGDSLTSYEFSTLDEDSLGSISGEIAIDLRDRDDAPVVLSFHQVSTTRSFKVPLESLRFHTPLPPGDYLLSGFIDEDQNGRVTPGTVIPARLAETQTFYPDTISVRARFETAGILLDFK